MASPSRLRVAVDVNGDIQAESVLKGIGERAYRTTPLMTRLLSYLGEISAERVKEAPYEPLTEGTIARKASQGEDTSIFRDEWRPIQGSPTRQGDMLYRALTEWGAPGQLRHVTRTWAVFGVQSAGQGPLFYARFVQNVKGKKRRILAIKSDQAVRIAVTVADYIMFDAQRGVRH